MKGIIILLFMICFVIVFVTRGVNRMGRQEHRNVITLVDIQDMGTILGSTSLRVTWHFLNSSKHPWQVSIRGEQCECVRVRINRFKILPGGTLEVEAMLPCPVDVHPKEPVMNFEQRLLLPIELLSNGWRYHAVGVVRGRVVCPLIDGPTIVTASRQRQMRTMVFQWQFHPAVNLNNIFVRCNLPYAAVRVGHRSRRVVLHLLPKGQKDDEPAYLSVYQKKPYTQIYKVPIIIEE